MPAAPSAAGPPRPGARKTVVRLGLAWVLLPAFFLVAGGSLGWWEAWVYCALVLVPMTVFAVHVTRTDPEFLEWRLTVKEKERTQRRVLSFGTPLFLALYVVPALDRRFGWSAPPLAAVIGAQALALASYVGILGVLLTNRWAGRTIETRPGQQVISTGPYAIVRHPMYAVTLLLCLATPVALGSLWGLIPAALIVPLLIVRIRNEEQVLLRELPGYADYRTKVRYRLVPRIW